MNKTRTIRQKVLISASQEEVYGALVNSRTHSEFTGAKATGAAKEGSKFTAWDGYITGRHLKLVKGKKIVQEWCTTEWPSDAKPSKLEFSFKKKGSSTEIIMMHSNVPAGQAASYAKGWHDFYWKPMRKYFEGKSHKN